MGVGQSMSVLFLISMEPLSPGVVCLSRSHNSHSLLMTIRNAKTFVGLWPVCQRFHSFSSLYFNRLSVIH